MPYLLPPTGRDKTPPHEHTRHEPEAGNPGRVPRNELFVTRARVCPSCRGLEKREQGRFYHTMEHVADMLEAAESDFKDIRRPRLVQLAIFFHDVVYDPKSTSNEEDSAALFQKFSEAAQMNPSDAETVSNYIIATKCHDVADSDDTDLRTFIDLDMAVLGRERTAYLTYASQVREEYAHVPTETYCRKRAQVLGDFLAKPIFATDAYQVQLEATARANLEAEIAMLCAGSVPSIL
ncbi:unnamed protein product [Ascophyllum nodosum]